MTTKNSSKKRSPENEEFEKLREYLMACPDVSKTSPAMKAALEGLDNELKRRERDAKLQKKFAQSTSLTETNSNSVSMSSSKGTSTPDDEWQDIVDDRKVSSTVAHGESHEEDEVEIIDMEGDTTCFGKEMADLVISSIADSQARARSPLAAIALALHAAMQSEVLGFACTGAIDDNEKAKSVGGFAPPIRELPKTQFLPRNWDKNASSSTTTSDNPLRVVLRYRKNDTGSVLLRVEMLEGSLPGSSSSNEVSVKLVPTNQEPPSQSLVFPLENHINLDSWNAALRASGGSLGIQPALHYKALPALLTSFSNTFDLGCVETSEQSATTVEPTNFIGIQVAKQPAHDPFKRECFGEGSKARPTYPDHHVDDRRVHPTIDSAFPRPVFATGDFAGDVHPLGGMGFDPLRRTGPDSTGNLMGPNHPAFLRGGGLTGVGDRSGYGMLPRYDPIYGPPGGPQEIDPERSRLPPQPGSGEHPDHLRPPNSFRNNGIGGPPNTLGNNNMFL